MVKQEFVDSNTYIQYNPDPNDPSQMIEQIEMDKFCQGTIIDDHWIITAATCCRRHMETPQEDYAKAFINFGATLSPFTPSTQAWLRLQLCATDH